MPRSNENQECKLFVGGLSINTTTDSLRAYFETFGEVTDAVVMMNNQTNKSKCFGFVTYATTEMVDLVQNKRPHTVDGKQVDTKRAMPKDDPTPESRVACKKIFVGGMKKSVTEDELRDHFSPYGVITECQLVLDKETKSSRGFGFVTFEDTDSVDKAILAKPHTIGDDSKADVKKALSRDEMANVAKKKAPSNGNTQSHRTDYYSPQQHGYQQSGWGGGYAAEQSAWNPQGGYGGYGGPNAYPPQQQWSGHQAWGGQQSVTGGWGDVYQTGNPGGAMRSQMGQHRPGPY